jgi:competence protein ComEA
MAGVQITQERLSAALRATSRATGIPFPLKPPTFAGSTPPASGLISPIETGRWPAFNASDASGNQGSPNSQEQGMKNMKYCLSLLVFFVAGSALAGPVDVNTADAATLSAELEGVGMSKAVAIVEYREANGPFQSPDDLILVKGIGERTVEINRDNILVQPHGASDR